MEQIFPGYYVLVQCDAALEPLGEIVVLRLHRSSISTVPVLAVVTGVEPTVANADPFITRTDPDP